MYVEPDYIIDIEYFVDTSNKFNDVAASRVSHPNQFPEGSKYRYTDQQLADFNDFVDTVISIIEHYDFDIVDEDQSGHSYAYYITFFPTDSEGNRWNESIQIKFRLADHPNTGADESVLNRKKRALARPQRNTSKPIVYIKSFFIGGPEYPKPSTAISAIKKLCEQLKLGDYSEFSD